MSIVVKDHWKQNLAHWIQLMRSGCFSMYSYNLRGNVQRYGNPEAPAYNLSNVRVKTAIFHGGVDALVTQLDVEKLYQHLPTQFNVASTLIPEFDHIGMNNNAMIDDDIGS